MAEAEEKWLTKPRICDSGCLKCQDRESKIIQWIVGLPSSVEENGKVKSGNKVD